VCALFLTYGNAASAAPPFLTDDPEPAEYHHFEVYLASQYSGDKSGYFAALPQYEVNYGAAPNLQLSVTTQMSLGCPFGGSAQYGFGDMNVGAKYRFVQEGRYMPQLAVFPALNVPTGEASRELGEGHTGYFLPMWGQKSWGPWTLCAGGGFWSNPGIGLKNYWFTGCLVTRQVSKRLSVGAEMFNTTESVVSGGSHTGFNIGATYDLDEGHHLLFSAGDDIHGTGQGIAYVAYGWTWGPEKEKEKLDKTAEPKAAHSGSEKQGG